jgi:hypothetical protein
MTAMEAAAAVRQKSRRRSLSTIRFHRGLEMSKKLVVDEYRVNLFKKKLREILEAPWVRFYWSIGGGHLCIDAYQVGPLGLENAAELLKRAGIEFRTTRRYSRLLENQFDGISIPVDQAALPERKRQCQIPRMKAV